MRIIVSDSSCLIDLRKADLLEAFLKLPYELVVPDVLLEDELLRFSAKQLARIRAGMTVVMALSMRMAGLSLVEGC